MCQCIVITSEGVFSCILIADVFLCVSVMGECLRGIIKRSVLNVSSF